MFIQKKTMRRREFIRRVAKAGMLLPFASQFLLGGRVNAAPFGTPNRVIFVYYPNGAQLARWHTNDINNLNYAMTPLQPYSNHLTELRNLTTRFGAVGFPSEHPGTAGSILSGGILDQPSIDAVIAEQIESSSLYQSMNFGFISKYSHNQGGIPVFRDLNGFNVIPEEDPNTTVQQYFSGISLPDPGGKNLLRQEILESMEADLATLRLQTLSTAQKNKLDEQATSLERLGTLLHNNLNLGNINYDVSMDFVSEVSSEQEAELLLKAEDLCRAQINNLVVSLEADLTRVATFQFMMAADQSIPFNFDSLKQDFTDIGWGERMHWNDNRSFRAARTPDADLLSVHNKWYNMMMAELLKGLSQKPDPLGGGTLSDTSLILMCTHIGDIIFEQDDMPWYFMGGGNGALNPGRVVDCSGKTTADLLFETGRIMGLNWSSFGNSQGDMGVPELRA